MKTAILILFLLSLAACGGGEPDCADFVGPVKEGQTAPSCN